MLKPPPDTPKVRNHRPLGSILFPSTAPALADAEPAIFADLNLGPVVDEVLGRAGVALRPLFWTPLADLKAVRYRQAVFCDLEQRPLADALQRFAEVMRRVHTRLAEIEQLEYRVLGDRLFAEAGRLYCAAVSTLAADLEPTTVASDALRRMHQYLVAYIASDQFDRLAAEADALAQQLGEVRYSLLIRGSHVTVRRFDPGPDFGQEVADTFARFREGEPQDHRVLFRGELSMGHLQEPILRLVAHFYPELFAALARFHRGYAGFVDDTLWAFAHDVQFYLAVRSYVDRLQAEGLAFCYPQLAERPRTVYAHATFDLALAAKLAPEHRLPVTNDFALQEAERVIVITGPNQGGKTTFARMLGQLHYLASLGLPIPGTAATLPLPDQVFTHFERQEQVATLRGKLEDELVRVRAILAVATDRSVVIMNESFSSTSLEDARRLGRRILKRLVERGALCVYVTFVDELAACDPAVVSMVATVDPDDPATRTFRVVRAPANGKAYAAAIARKYGLLPGQLRERVRS